MMKTDGNKVDFRYILRFLANQEEEQELKEDEIREIKYGRQFVMDLQRKRKAEHERFLEDLMKE